MTKARMKKTVRQVGTGMYINEGDIVWAEKATNLPTPNQFFVRPVDGWRNGTDINGELSICVEEQTIEILEGH